MQTRIGYDSALLGSVDAGDRVALALVTRRVVARLRALGAYDLQGRWDDVCEEIVRGLLEEVRSGVGDAVGLQRRIDRAVWRRMAPLLRRTSLSRGGGSHPTAARGEAGGPLLPIDTERVARLAARQAFARIASARQELLWRRFLGGEHVEALAAGRSMQEVEREIDAGRREFRNLLELFDAAECEARELGIDPSQHSDGGAHPSFSFREEGELR